MSGSTTTTTTTTPKSTNVVILLGPASNNSAASGTIPMVVWAHHERSSRDSQNDPWKSTLEYYEWLEDTARWTHLDQLLVRFGNATSSFHVGTSDNISAGGGGNGSKKGNGNGKSNARAKRMKRTVESLQLFLEDREAESATSNRQDGDAGPACHLHLAVPSADSSKIDAAMTQLLLEDADVQLAYRGNVQISQGLLQQGLTLFLQCEGLLASGASVPDQWLHSIKIQQGLLDSHLVMDRTAAQCIHLLPPPNAGVASVVGGHTHNNSLWGFLSKPCLTNMGKQKLQVWLRQPLIELDKIVERQDAVTALLGLGADSLRDALKTFGGVDLPQLAAILGGYGENPESATDELNDTPVTTNANVLAVTSTKKPLQALYQLYLLASSKLPQLLEAVTSIESSSTLLTEATVKLARLVGELERCQGLVEAVLDLDQAPREYLIKSSFSEELHDLYQELQGVQQAVDDEFEQMQQVWTDTAGNSKAGQVRLEQLPDEASWQFRLPNTNDAKILRNLGSKVKTHRILKNGVYFSTQGLRQLSAKYQELSADYSGQSRKVIQDAMAVATTYQTVVERTAEVVSMLDVLCAMAHVAAYSPHEYCKPALTDSEEDGMGITLEAARHPCVELQEDVTDYIPNDISLKFGESNFLLVTGPNMGGKSTYIRALGAIVCMAQIGCYVPCRAAKINLCHAILARVGAGDLQERGISTFMAEMLEASAILRTATKRSLIIIDELGRGTSTFDGYGLARAIIEYLMQRIGCMVVFATHFHELTALPGVQNCHVTAQKGDQGLTFLYKVQPGPCLESFGIQVAEMANVPSCVIEDAKRKAEELENFGGKNATNNKKRYKLTLTADEENGIDDKAFVEKFRRLDVPAILENVSKIDDEYKNKLLAMLA